MVPALMANRAIELVRNLWISAQLSAPPRVQQTIMPRLHEGKEIIRLLTRPYLPVYQIEGRGQGGDLTVTYVGLDYAKPSMKCILFTEEPAEWGVGRVPFWRCGERVGSLPGDLVIVEGARHLVRGLPRQDAIILPQFVHHVLDVRGEWGDVKRRFRKSVRHDFRLTRKYGYQYDVSHEDRDFEAFYRDMYLPTMEIRHGTLSSPMSVRKAYQHFRHGVLFFVTRDGRRVCGSICYLQQDVVHCMIMGVVGGDEGLMREGAVGALNCLRIQWANERGYSAVNFLGSDPFLKDSLFQYKRKWGSAVGVPPHLHRQIWIGVRRNTPAVSQFLKENPFVVVDRDGKLHGLIVVDDPHDVSTETKQEWDKRLVTPGLSSLLIRSVDDFTAGSADVNDPY